MSGKLIRGSILCANGGLNHQGYSVQTAAFPTAGQTVEDSNTSIADYCSFAYSALACLRMGTSGSASFHRLKKSWYAMRDLALSPARA
jgi:hypothetical protein